MDYYTVKEAANVTGTSISSIRRFFEPIRDDDHHEYRGKILPSVQEVQKLKRGKKKPSFSWKLSRELLDVFMEEKELEWPGSKQGQDATQQKTEPEKRTGTPEVGTLELLKQTVDMLSNQMEKKDKMIDELLERQRESNVLLKGLQERIPQLNAGKPTESSAIVRSNATEEGSERDAVIKKRKRSWLSDMLTKEVRLFK